MKALVIALTLVLGMSVASCTFVQPTFVENEGTWGGSVD